MHITFTTPTVIAKPYDSNLSVSTFKKKSIYFFLLESLTSKKILYVRKVHDSSQQAIQTSINRESQGRLAHSFYW